MFDNNPLRLRFPPSKYPVWGSCSAAPYAWTKGDRVSVPDSERFPVERDRYTIDGLIAHTLKLMSAKPTVVSPRFYVGETITLSGQQYPITHKHADMVESAIDYMFSFMKNEQWSHHCEMTLPMNGLISHQNVIIDDIIETENIVHIFDFKTGGASRIKAQDNGQLMCGLWSFVDYSLLNNIKRRFYEMYIHVIQPHFDNYDCHKVSPEELHQFQIDTSDKVKLSNSKDRKFTPGDHCRYCQVNGCGPRLSRAMQLVSKNKKHGIHTMSDLICVDDLSDQQMIDLYSNCDFIIATCKNVRKTMTYRACAGKNYKGLKLVAGPEGNREFVDNTEAISYLRNKGFTDQNLYNKELVSVPQSERILGKKNLDNDFHDLYTRKPAYPILAFEDDQREEWFKYKKRKMDSDFETLDDSPSNDMDLSFLDDNQPTINQSTDVDLSFLDDDVSTGVKTGGDDMDLDFLNED